MVVLAGGGLAMGRGRWLGRAGAVNAGSTAGEPVEVEG